MANYFDKGIQVTAGFSLGSKAPLDTRTVVENLSDLDNHIAENRYYEGMEVYVLENKTKYIYNGTTFEEFVSGGGDVEKIYTSTPIGTVLSFAGQTPPNGYLLCDGGSYAVADYQDLYDVIGNTYGGDSTNFNVPDYRETVLVGVGENTTDTIKTHDVYELGEFKDDCIQDHKHSTTIGVAGTTDVRDNSFASTSEQRYNAYTKGMYSGRIGTTTHGKQKGVTYIIKAFHTNEGVDTTVELDDNVANHINNRVDNKLVEDMSDYINERVEDRVTEVVHRLIEGTEYPTTETCPVGCWYGMYF